MKMKPTIVYFNQDSYTDTDITVLKYLTRDFNVIWFYLYESLRPDAMRYTPAFAQNYADKYGLTLEIVDPQLMTTDARKILFYRKVAKQINACKPELVYSCIRTPYWIVASHFFLKCKKRILGIHDAKPHTYSSKLTTFTEKYCSLLSIKWNKNFVTFSKGQKELFYEIFGRQSTLVGMSVKDFGPSINQVVDISESVRLLFFGRIEQYKGLDMLISALEDLNKQGVSNLRLTIAGKGDFWKECEQYIKTPSLYNLKVRFVQNDEVPDLMATHHFLVLPYRDATQSGPLATALAYDLPIIAPKYGCFGDVYNSNAAFLYEQGKLNEALKEASMMSSSEYAKMKSQVGVIKNKYSEKNIADNYIREFKRIIG